MVESDVEVFVKEDRRPEATLILVPPPIFLRQNRVSILWVLIATSICHEIKSYGILI
jgi:hypothetical protein